MTDPEIFEATITSLENTKDLWKHTLIEHVNAMQVREQRRLIKVEGLVEGELQAKLKIKKGEISIRNKYKEEYKKTRRTDGEKIENFFLASIVEILVIFLSNVGENLMWSVKSKISKESWENL